MNPLVNNGQNLNLINRFYEFQKQMQGKDPEKIIKDMMNSGQISKQDLDKAVNTAKQLSQFISMR